MGKMGLADLRVLFCSCGKSEDVRTSKWRSRMMESEAQGKGQSGI